MPTIKVSDIEIAYDVAGSEDDDAMVLIAGLGGQMVDYDDAAVGELVEQRYRVIRLDNRDSGASTHLVQSGTPDLVGGFLSGNIHPPYTLLDMANDVVGVLDHLGVERAHVVGVSMGGMIAQTLAITHPEMVLSLASVMSTTGAKGVGVPSAAVIQMVLGSMAQGGAVDPMEMMRTISSPGFVFDEARVRERIALHEARSQDGAGTLRQLAAILASNDRTEALSKLMLPTVVIHGRDDPLISLSGGEATAKAIPGAKLVVFDGMGHDIPPELWPKIRDEILDNAKRARGGS